MTTHLSKEAVEIAAKAFSDECDVMAIEDGIRTPPPGWDKMADDSKEHFCRATQAAIIAFLSVLGDKADRSAGVSEAEARELLATEFERVEMTMTATTMRENKVDIWCQAAIAAIIQASRSDLPDPAPIPLPEDDRITISHARALARQPSPPVPDLKAAIKGLLCIVDGLLARAPVPSGWRLVPEEPTEAMWGELARDLVMWQRWGAHAGDDLYKHLRSIGRDIPEWLLKEIPDEGRVPPKGTVAACIYKAMIAAAPVHLGKEG